MCDILLERMAFQELRLKFSLSPEHNIYYLPTFRYFKDNNQRAIVPDYAIAIAVAMSGLK